ncbi:MAG: peptidoglycan-binding protein [Alphaproteobacteria bacterium HGW-Alphaproteobacteria-2]|nr:MAG: peptidoglycan-binding protein [Alphaproteobacteria bacterium HGW-Alphaproteobacteria-2]
MKYLLLAACMMVLSLPAATATAQTAVLQAPEAAPEETLNEAYRSEATLDAETRRELQRALAWFGFYASGIDGAFGRGTRMAMAAWQQANALEETGVLTTRQRVALLDAFAQARARLGIAPHVDTAAGIALDWPLALLRFDRHEPPFAHFEARGPEGVRGFLISQPGDAAALAGLYDVLQTLAVIPVEGDRQLGRNGFTITGADATRAAHVWAQLSGGRIKGFALIWPRALDAEMQRAVAQARASFRDTGAAVLDPLLDGPGSRLDGIDLVAGLEIRRPRFTRSGVYLDAEGSVLTAAEAVAGCAQVTLDHDIEAEVVLMDATLGIAVLRPRTPVSPLRRAVFADREPGPGSEVAVAGYSFGGALSAASVVWGRVAADTGPGDAASLRRLALDATPGDTGGPVLDAGGTVAGLLLGAGGTSRSLPEGVQFAVTAQPIVARLRAAGLMPETAAGPSAMTPEHLANAAREMTALVSCWDN